MNFIITIGFSLSLISFGVNEISGYDRKKKTERVDLMRIYSTPEIHLQHRRTNMEQERGDSGLEGYSLN